VLVAAVFVRLGFWQISRLHERESANASIEANLAMPAEPLSEVLADGGDVEYRHALVAGQYAPDYEVLLRNRAYEDQTGFHVLTPLVTASGTAVLIDRGWVPLALSTPPVLEAPSGVVEVEGLIRTSKSAGSGLGPKDPPTGTLTMAFWPDVNRLAPQMPFPLMPVYVELESQIPAGTGDQPIPAPKPELTNGPHLSYAIQWFSFALIGIVGYVFLVKKRGRA